MTLMFRGEDIADNSYVEIAETIITDKNDDEYDDFIENSSFASSIQIAYANGSATVTGSVSGVTVTTNGASCHSKCIRSRV